MPLWYLSLFQSPACHRTCFCLKNCVCQLSACNVPVMPCFGHLLVIWHVCVSDICLPSDMSLSQVSTLVFAICLSSNMSASQISFLVSFFCTAWHLASLANIVPVGVSSKCPNCIAQFSFPCLIIYNYLYVSALHTRGHKEMSSILAGQ
jgi:hypothetical protein